MRVYLPVLALLALGACASPSTRSGFLSSYEGMTPRTDAVRAKIDERKADARLQKVTKVGIEPARLADGAQATWLTPDERDLLLRELDAQLCFEISERYEIVPPDAAEARVRAAVTRVRPTGRAGSVASAAAGFFIPGPVGLRVPGTLGGLAAEAEMVSPTGDQLAAISWSRRATAVGTDDPSLSRIGDALQFVEPFADHAAAAMTPEGLEKRDIPDPDPCAAYGPRFRPEGFLTKAATGLYVPGMSGAKPAKADPPSDTEQTSGAR